MSAWRRYPTPAGSKALSRTDKVFLALEIVATFGRARRLLRRRGLEGALVVLRAARSRSSGQVPDARLAGIRLGRAVTHTLAVVPADSRCLIRSLVLTALLTRRGIESSLVIGVRPAERFGAHAWVEHEGRPLLPSGAGPAGEATFERLVAV
jgi:hypothetical protein